MSGSPCQKCGSGSSTIAYQSWWGGNNNGYLLKAGYPVCICIEGYSSPSGTDSDYGYCVKCSSGTTTSLLYQGIFVH